jgi:multiple sugar transport system permease protein
MATAAATLARPRGRLRRGPSRRWTVAAYVGLALFVVWTVIPFYWMVMASLKSNRQIYQEPSLSPPTTLYFGNYQKLLSGEFGGWIVNSAIVATGSTLLSIVVGIFAAYAISRLSFKGTGMVARGLVFSYLVPTSLLFIPLFQLVSPIQQGLEGRQQLFTLFLVYLTFTIPFCTWLLIGYFRTIPKELEDAALIDGCSKLGSLFRVTLPLAGPAIAVVALFSFTLSWNEFLYALVFISGQAARTTPVGLTSLIAIDVFFWGEMMGGAVLTSIPPVVIYILAQRLVVKGLSAGAVKG